MAYLKSPRYQTKILNNRFSDGINTFLSPFEIGENELTDARNICGDEYPAAVVRPCRSSHAPNVTSPNCLGQRANGTLHLVAGTSWVSYSTVTGAYTAIHSTAFTKGKLLEFVKPSIRETIFFSTAQTIIYDGAGTTDITDVNRPLTRYVTAFRDRIYGLIDNQIKHSANRASTNWTTADDAGYISVANMKGTPSGMATYNDHVIAFTDQSMHELYGTQPLDYSLTDVSLEIGCAEDRSIKECRGILYWLDYKGVYRYTGGRPTPVGDPVKTFVDNINWGQKTKICAGVLGDKYFLSIPHLTATDPNVLLEFNSKLGKWYVHNGNYIDFISIQDELFGLTSTGGIHNMESTKTVDPDNVTLEWYFVTKPFMDNSIEYKKTLSSLWLTHKTPTGGVLRLGYSTNVDSASFSTLAGSTDTTPCFTVDSSHHTERVLVPLTHLQNVPFYRLRVSGEGRGTVNYLQRNIRVRGR